MFIPGRMYLRSEIHKKVGGQEQGGISTPAAHNIVLIFTGSTGAKHGYADHWTPEGDFLYTGEGQYGDMEFVRGNSAIRDHVATGKDLLLFEVAKDSLVRFISPMVCVGYQFGEGPDTAGKFRRTIVFRLCKPQDMANGNPHELHFDSSSSLSTLRKKALEESEDHSSAKDRKTKYYVRSEAIKLYALKRASGICEGCGEPAPFKTSAGEPYLEVHHIRRMSDGGPDHPNWVAAVCPNCHRRSHHAKDAAQFNEHLSNSTIKKEQDIVEP